MHHISDEAILEEFKTKLKYYTRQAECGRSFVLVDSLQGWLNSPVEGQGTHADRLLHNVAYKDRPKPGVPISPEKLKPGDGCCLLVFCILQLLGRGDLLHVFSKKGKVDHLLPLSLHDLNQIFKSGEVEHPMIAFQFYNLQHQFRPARFDLHGEAEWDEETVVPIYRKNHIKSGATASLWQIDVPEEFVGENLRDVASGSRFNVNTDNEPDWRYQFALKTFPDKHGAFYENEVNAFLGLKDHTGMVRWLADYEQAHSIPPTPPGSRDQNLKSNTSKTYNLLLEYGSMDLGVYFREKLPPVLSWEIEAFWKSLSAVAYATKGIHNLKVDNGWKTKEYFGWHADIKPDNILFFEDRLKKDDDDLEEAHTSRLEANEITFKLADPGFAKFVPKQDKPTDVPKEYLNGGTSTYGAPEYPGRSKHPVPQAIDIWSLACVFSLAATWVVCDYPGIAIFQKVRQLAIKKHRQAKSNRAPCDQRSIELCESDQFHDGSEVLGAVIDWHKYLRTVSRETDTVTSRVLDLVDESMLVASPDLRINASDLCTKLDSIFESCPRKSGPQLPENIVTLLGEIDEEESCQATRTRRSRHNMQDHPSSDKTIIQNGRISLPRAERPLTTTHRQSIWPDQSLRQQDGTYPEKQDLHINIIPEQQPLSIHSARPPQTPTNQPNNPSGSSIPRQRIQSRSSGTPKKHSSQNYFQACDAMEKKGWLNKIGLKNHKAPDGLLTSYFRGTRDIIFLVDNADSMDDHWYEATRILEMLVKKAKGVDEDGMDLRFTTGKTALNNKDSASKFVESMDAARPMTRPKEKVYTDLRSSLGTVLNHYLARLKNGLRFGRAEVKDAVLIILTDGIWAGMEDKKAVAEQVKTFSNSLKDLRYDLKERPFSIQFIQFGYDPLATQTLRYLDDYLHTEGIPDIIDTEHSTGDVNKMLLGSFVEEYDKDEGDQVSLDGSAGSPPQFGERMLSPESSYEEDATSGESLPPPIQHSHSVSRHARPFSSYTR